MSSACSLLHLTEEDDRVFAMADYEAALARWCPGCGDHSVLTAVQRLMADEQLKPEDTVFVSGIGCSSRFPHYMKTYGFHGIHGRALPVSTGIKLHRPDLTVFTVMGDGDCVSIGAGHWIHSIRYNVNITALLLDNNIYGLTKMQTSPTTPQGQKSNTQPQGSWLPPMNPLETTLGVTNASFVAQTAEWVPAHLFATLKRAYHHKGFSFVRILQRCPAYLPKLFEEAITNPDRIEMLVHPDGVEVPELAEVYKDRVFHDPTDIDAARRYAEDQSKVRLGVFFRDESRPRYEDIRHLPTLTAEEKLQVLEQEFDRYAV
ncbi:MAG: thiamine pyrophosphate-dependent enzyme [Longimicrobiales bacterium]